MPTARLRAQCTDFKTSLSPPPEALGATTAPLCPHPLQHHYVAGAASPGHAVYVAHWWPATAFTVSQNQKRSIAFPFLSQWILDSVAAATKPSPCLPKHTLELHTEGGRKSLVYVDGSVFSDVSASFEENVEAR